MVFYIVSRFFRGVLRMFGYLLAVLLFVFLVQRSTYPMYIRWNAVSAVVGGDQFDYLGWEINALATKAAQVLWGFHPFMSEEDRSQYVRDYMADLAQARRLEAEIQMIFTDPTINNPQLESADRREERDALRADLRRRQPLMESILEGQVAAVMVDEGFGVLGQLLPPISMHFTQMPNLLIGSPRDQIAFEISINLDPLPVEEIVAIETRIEEEQNMSALIVPLGGMALYPAMIQETTSIPWALETFAHEWMHHYLFFFPLGLNYDFAGETRIINETVADIFGKEAAQIVLRRYYPELAPPPVVQSDILLVSQVTQQAPFDFGRAMHVTRTVVDKIMADVQRAQDKSELLDELNETEWSEIYAQSAENYIFEAEAYMEARRILFYENGYRLRRLNQAYFAFYGGYQGGIPGVGGQDPIGPAVQEIRAMSPRLHDFVVNMRNITTRDELVAARDAMRVEFGG